MAIKKRKNPNAWVVSSKDRGRRSIKNSKVFLKNNEEFEIELFNPLNKTILAKIYLNNNSISNNGLIVNPGERIYLDCFIDSKKKFIFKTYNVDDSDEAKEAIKNNGDLIVYFYEEKILDNSGNIWLNNNNFNYPYDYTLTSTLNFNGTTNSNLFSNDNITHTNNSLETGRVEGENESTQSFITVNKNFNSFYVSKTELKLLPKSLEPIDSKSIKKTKNSNDNFDTIKRLKELYDNDILTEKEFIDKKKEILSRI